MALSCETHTAYLYDRGGVRKIGALGPLSRVKWERRRDDISAASAYVATPGKECSEALALAEAGRVELVIFRGKDRVWEGPITRISYEGDSVQIDAKDVMYYALRTIIRGEYDNRHPRTVRVLDRVKRVMTAELARKEALDPPVNVLPHVQYLYVLGGRTYLRSYYDTSSAKRAVGAAKTVQEMEDALNAVQAAYGLALNIGVAVSAGEYGMSWDPARLQDWQLRQYMIMVAEAFSAYPPEYIQSANIEAVYFVRNLNMGVGFNPGGSAVDQRAYFDVADYNAQDNVVFGSEHLIHHELCHLQANTFGTSVIQARWLALNPPGFSYGLDFLNPPYGGLNPPGFIRDYGRYSFAEDLADVAGAVMARTMKPFLDELLATDPVVAAKVALYKEWMALNSDGLIEGEGYYRALTEGTIVTPGENNATDARTASWIKPYEVTLHGHIDNYAARGGIDYTVLGRSVLFFDVHQRIGQTAMVTKDDFLGDPVITQYGSELTTYVAMTDGKGNFGAAGGIDPYYGEWEVLHQAYDETAAGTDTNNPPSVAELTSQAVRTQKQGRVPPLVVRIPDNTRLNPNGVLQISDLVPGVWIPLSASLPGRTVSQMQKLDSMTVEETGKTGEVVKVVLSPAYQETFVEETP